MTYEYLCTNTECQHGWEVSQKITEAPIKICPKCGEESAKRLISSKGGFVLKGGGWYADLYSSTVSKD